MKNHEFQELVDQNLSGLVWDERKCQKVLHAISEEEKPVKKISTTFILVAAILCISVTALAAGLIFSPRYDAVRIANQTMEEKYGITADLLSLFYREVKENGDGTSTVTFSIPDTASFPTDRIGEYIRTRSIMWRSLSGKRAMMAARCFCNTAIGCWMWIHLMG